jgi:predicted permease
MSWVNRLRALFRRDQLDRDLADELRFHVEMRTRENVAAGMSPEEARETALRQFGNVGSLQEQTRDAWGFVWLEALGQDLKYGLRMLAKTPGFTAVAVLTLALGIGANTAIFSLVHAVLLKALPVAHPEELVLLRWESPYVKTDYLPYPTFKQLRDNSQAFDGMVAFYSPELATSVDGAPGMAAGELVSGNFFSMLGVQPTVGRTFTLDEDRVPGGDPVAMISYGYWKRQFGLDPAAVGKSITLNGVPFSIVGVTPPGFDGVTVGDTRDIWIPMMMQAQVMDGRSLLDDPKGWFFQIIARRKSGVSLDQASANLNVTYQQIARQETGARMSAQEERDLARQKIELLPASKGLSDVRDRFAQPLLVLMALVSLVLLIACANVASLLLARTSARQKEMAVRAALGAGRVRLVRQLLTESLLLGMLGGVAGFLLARYADDLLLALPLVDGGRLVLTLQPNATILIFTALIAVMAAFLFGSAPAWDAARTDLNAALNSSTRGVVTGTGSGRSRWTLRSLVVIGEVALSLLLLAGAGMLLRSLQRLRDVNPGFNPDGVLLFGVDPALVGYREDRIVNFYERLADDVAALPGVRSVGLAAVPPISPGQWRTGVFVQGHLPGANEDTTVAWNLISPYLFRTLEIPLLQGRDFTPQDDSTAPKVAIVNQAMAQFYFGNQSAIGKRFSFIRPGGGEIEIIGVVGDTKYAGLRDATGRMLYLPYLQAPVGSSTVGMTLEIRTAGNSEGLVGAVRQTIREVNSHVPIRGYMTLAQEVDNSLSQERVVVQLSSFFGLLALLLASLGLYGVMAYAVARRTGEIGVRMALGAPRSQVLWMVLRESLEIVGLGVLIGIPLVLVFSRLISSQLYGVRRGDPLTICISIVLQAVIAAIATYIPARRATRVDPMVALRYE